MLNNNIIIVLIILIYLNSLFIGFLLGRLYGFGGVSNSTTQSFFTKQKTDQVVKNNLSIDDKKIVVDIKTDTLEKKYNTLGDVTQKSDDISSSVNKLKNLKG